jgi:AcrR family transcriptional regulator
MNTITKADSAPMRDRIVAAAIELFADRGFAECSLKELARAVGIKPPSLYAHFPGKDAIFGAALDRAIADWRSVLDAAFAAAEPAADLAEGAFSIAAAFLAAVAGSTAYRFWTRVYVFPPAGLDPGRFEDIRRLDAEFAARLRAYCAPRAGLDPESASLRAFAASLSHFITGIMVDSLGAVPAAAELRAGIDLLALGLASSPIRTPGGQP